MAVNKEINTPKPRLMEKPFTMLAPNELPKTYKIKQVISVDVFESRMDGHARLQPRSMACWRVRPERNSSFNLSKIKMIASC